MSKLNSQLLAKSVEDILAYSNGETITVGKDEVKGKKRNFHETIELQIALKNYDPTKDKRFSGTFKLPTIPKPNLKICVIGNAVHCELAEKNGYDFMTVDDLKKFNKNKKVIKKFAKKYDAFLASDTLIKQIPRLLGPSLNKAGKFPTLITSGEDINEKANAVRATIKFQMKKVLCLNLAVGHVGLTKEEIIVNTQLAANFLASLLKKNWQNIKVLYLKIVATFMHFKTTWDRTLFLEWTSMKDDLGDIRRDIVTPLQTAVFNGSPILLTKQTEDALMQYETQELYLSSNILQDDLERLWQDVAELLLQTTIDNNLTSTYVKTVALPVMQCIGIVYRLDELYYKSHQEMNDRFKWMPLMIYACSHYTSDKSPWRTIETTRQAEFLLGCLCKKVAKRTSSHISSLQLTQLYYKRVLSLIGNKCTKEAWIAVGTAAPYAFRQVVSNVYFPDFDHDGVGRILALTLPLLDQTNISVQSIGLDVLHHLVIQATPTDIRWHGDIILHMLEETLKIATSDVDYLNATLACLNDALSVISVGHECKHYTRFFPFLLRAWDLASNVTIKKIYLVRLRPSIKAMGAPHSLQIVHYLPSILTILMGCMENKFLAMDAIETLNILINHAWIRINHHVVDIVIAIFRCLVYTSLPIQEETRDNNSSLFTACVDTLKLLQLLTNESILKIVETMGDTMDEVKTISEKIHNKLRYA
ncbi:60S ribosomal protein L10a-1 [Thraustotheca clavata]|uniref:60S ribosomal protein L10a-1 n=1 Tax=Thraustotheca clavata TaxID=74557 RepID=A0A1W0A8C4_9STRA|nr:60S ribosomal protein L10a-1 [Thraustotheca clavata]